MTRSEDFFLNQNIYFIIFHKRSLQFFLKTYCLSCIALYIYYILNCTKIVTTLVDMNKLKKKFFEFKVSFQDLYIFSLSIKQRLVLECACTKSHPFVLESVETKQA